MQIHHTLNLKIESKLQSPKVLKSNIHRRHISQMSHKCDILIPIFHVCVIEVNLLYLPLLPKKYCTLQKLNIQQGLSWADFGTHYDNGPLSQLKKCVKFPNFQVKNPKIINKSLCICCG